MSERREHIYAGNCPDKVQPLARDPECPACQALRECEHGQLLRQCERCDDATEIARLRARVAELEAALAWYGDEARALAKHVATGVHSNAVLASVTVLSLDGGRRADAARGAKEQG